MTRYYDEPIQMVCASDNTPTRFIWRETAYQVRAVLAHWHLRDRWWATEGEAKGAAKAGAGRSPARHLPATDRFYWRLHCASPSVPMVFCVVYHDIAVAAEQWPWRLERVYD